MQTKASDEDRLALVNKVGFLSAVTGLWIRVLKVPAVPSQSALQLQSQASHLSDKLLHCRMNDTLFCLPVLEVRLTPCTGLVPLFIGIDIFTGRTNSLQGHVRHARSESTY